MANFFIVAWTWLKAIFTSKAAGIIWKTLFSNIKTKVVTLLTDPKVQAEAWNLAIILNRKTDMTGVEKAAEFNKQMFAWLKENGYLNYTTSLVNTLRELAVQAITVKTEKNEELTMQNNGDL